MSLTLAVQGRAASVADQMVFAARLPAVDRRRAGVGPTFFARTREPSTHARDQSRQIERFRAGLETFLRGCATEITAKLTDSVPDHQTCLQVRLESFGCDFIELMTEYGAAVDMSDALPTWSRCTRTPGAR